MAGSFISFAKIIGDLFGGLAVKIVAAGASIYLASRVYGHLHASLAPVLAVLH